MRDTFEARSSALEKFWWWLRQVTGDAAYENYRRHCAASPGLHAAPPMTREQFYADSLRRRYSSINRCC